MISETVFNWKEPDRYVELLYFEMEVADVFQAEMYALSDEGKVAIIKKWLAREGLQFIQTLIHAEKEACKSAPRLFNVLKEKSGHSIMRQFYHYNTVNYIEK